MTPTAEKCMTVRTRSFSGSEFIDVLATLRRERFTGKVTLNFSQGTIGQLQAEDSSNTSHLTAANNST